jgi:hypothetical protein
VFKTSQTTKSNEKTNIKRRENVERNMRMEMNSSHGFMTRRPSNADKNNVQCHPRTQIISCGA